MKSLRISKYNINLLPKIFDRFQNKKPNDSSFLRWFLIWYFGSSILLLLSLHSYYMGIGKF